VEAATDKATYRPGERVQVRATLHNGSAVPCLYNSYMGGSHVVNAGGLEVAPSPVFIADAFKDTPLAAGATLTQSPSWDQRTCSADGVSCAQAPPGTYTFKVSWTFEGPPVEGATTFRLAGA